MKSRHVLRFYAFFVMSAGAVILTCNFDHKVFAQNNGVEVLFTHLCGKTNNLSGEQSTRSIGDFFPVYLVVP